MTQKENAQEFEQGYIDIIFRNIFGERIEADQNLMQGLANLNMLPSFDTPPPAVKGRIFEPGLMGFRKNGAGKLNLAIACGVYQVRYITLAKYIAMVENLHLPESSTIMLQNFQDQDEHKSGKGQVLGRINAESSAIMIIHGLTGRIIKGMSDIALYDVYYLDRRDMTAFYLAAKAQISNGDCLETMIAVNDGWKAFSVPLDPFNPHEL